MEQMLASSADAQIILKLYELRTEALMRQARAWVAGEFWPRTADEYFAVANNPADPHNAFLRQVLSYWEMAAAMVLHGAVSAELFLDCNGEGFFFLAKFSTCSTPFARKTPTSWSRPRLWSAASAAPPRATRPCSKPSKPAERP